MSNIFDDLPQTFVIEYEDGDDLVHTPENGYCCGDPTCYCAGGDDQPDAQVEQLDTRGMLN